MRGREIPNSSPRSYQPGLPLKKGRCGTMTHDYKRNGTICLFAALNILEGTVIGSCYSRHRNMNSSNSSEKSIEKHQKGWISTLSLTTMGLADHVKQWLAKHPRFHPHFIPTSSSWVNLIERWFAEISRKRIRRGVFHSVLDLVDTIQNFIKTYNENPKPFVWNKNVDEILEKVNRCNLLMATLH